MEGELDTFRSLYARTRPHLDKPFVRLPTDLKTEIKALFSLVPWDKLDPRYRAEKLFWYDVERDPKTNSADLILLEQLSGQLDEVSSRIFRDAAARWGLDTSRPVTWAPDIELEKRNFRLWFFQWWRAHNQTAPSRAEAYQEFAKPRGIGRRVVNSWLTDMRPGLRQKRGQPGVSKRASRKTK